MIIKANVTQESVLQCAIYQDPDFPLSINSVIFQNHKAISANLSAVLVIPNLGAGLEYRLYCITRDFSNIISMSYGRLIETAITVQMKGFRQLYVDLSSSVFSSTDQHLNVLTLSWQALPTVDLTVVLNTVYGENVTINRSQNQSLAVNISSVFEPKIFTFDTSLKLLTFQASLPSNLVPGTYTLDFALLGPYASDYDIAYRSERFLVNNTYQPPAPELMSVAFSNDGSFLIVTFNMNTNYGGLRTQFECSLLLDFQFAEESLCVWEDKSTLHVYLKVAVTVEEIEVQVELGDVIVLLPDILRAECTSAEVEFCLQYSASGQHNTTVSAPLHPITPALLLSAPTVISACSGFILDLTGSTGDGGRSWTTVSIVVESAHSSTRGMLNNYYSEVYKVLPPSPVARNHFRAGVNYTFHVQLCNFLQQCSTTHIHHVQVMEGEVPNVSFFGMKYRHIYRYNQLSLRSNAFSTFCGTPVTTKDLEYTWDIFQDGAEAEFQSISKQPSVYILPPYSLLAAGVYNVSVTVRSNITDLSATATMDIFVGIGNVQAVVNGGTTRSLSVGSRMVLDASQSYDEDMSGVSGFLAGLDFQWSCGIVEPVVNTSDCGLDFLYGNTTDMVTLVSRGESYVGTTSAIRVVVYKEIRIDAVTINIMTIAADSPNIIVTLDAGNNNNNPLARNKQQVSLMNKIKLLGSVELFAAGSATWVIDDPAVFLHEVSLTPVTSQLDVTSTSFNLVLQPYALVSTSIPTATTALTTPTSSFSSSFLFSLQSGASISSIEVTTTESPYGGQLISAGRWHRMVYHL